MVRAKFKCVSVTKREGFNGHPFVWDAEFNVVYGGSAENEKFYAATPSGNVKLGTYKEDLFEPGKEYYLDFTIAE